MDNELRIDATYITDKYMLWNCGDTVRITDFSLPEGKRMIFNGSLDELADVVLSVTTLKGALKQATEQLLELQAEKEWTPSRA